MNTARRILHLFRDSPNFGRDRANLLSGFTIGTAALLLNAAVLFMVLPMMIEPDERLFRTITENVEYGQLLALILLGGATAFATVLIPLRLMTVFWGPRVSGYFDQIVLSGIAPFRFVIGKATSQNLFLGLILFLLLPYLVLSLTMGGVKLGFFLAALVLVWLYCMAIALVTIWLSLYFNELLAVLCTIAGASIACGFGCSSWARHAVPVTPFPVLLQPIYASIPYFESTTPVDFIPTFVSCAVGMGSVICISLLAIYLGPLYGVIRENSTFGEVVRAGDSKYKRWFRLRYHIQRPSELAFFYENRSDTFRRWESRIRWGVGLAALMSLSFAAYSFLVEGIARDIINRGRGSGIAYGFHVGTLAMHGVCLLIGVFVFSHPKNTTLLRLPWIGQRTISVSRLDTTTFLTYLVYLALLSIGTVYFIEQYIALPVGQTLFPPRQYGNRGDSVDFMRTLIEGGCVLSLAGMVVYTLHRFVCLFVWLKLPAFLLSAATYFFVMCLAPFLLAIALMTVPKLRESASVELWETVAMSSPITALVSLFNELDPPFPSSLLTSPFYVVHVVLLALVSWGIVRRERKLRGSYLSPTTEPVT